ncbi:hypothetical protein OE88DRAFT_1257863 [Heliocybe sulcata]|uniref:Uncharacterized protein n=1 Tax=Heliocybe sulcata TaxID=5364 RepID=A0A5C3NC29_9AGAM|nr:hypothetical protein OE88DRAFT_1257863 [Heliocybe sulcata]
MHDCVWQRACSARCSRVTLQGWHHNRNYICLWTLPRCHFRIPLLVPDNDLPLSQDLRDSLCIGLSCLLKSGLRHTRGSTIPRDGQVIRNSGCGLIIPRYRGAVQLAWPIIPGINYRDPDVLGNLNKINDPSVAGKRRKSSAVSGPGGSSVAVGPITL